MDAHGLQSSSAWRARRSRVAVVAVLGAFGLACSNEHRGTGGPGAVALTSASITAAPNPETIINVTGGTAETSGNVVKINFPRTDVPIRIDGWNAVPPFMGLTSYAAFMPHEKGGVMMMGDFVLFEDEVNTVMSAAFDHGLEVTALHNHFFFDSPHVYFMHIAGTGSVEQVGAGVKAAHDAVQNVRRDAKTPRDTFGTPPIPASSRIDGKKLDSEFGVKGKAQDGMYKATFGRSVQSSMCDGCTVGGAMGMNTWAAFAGTDEDAVVDGDFAVREDELQGVLKTLRAGGINIVAIHSHTMGETPRILFLHYWGRGASADLAKTVKAAVDKTAWEGHPGVAR